MSIEQSSRPGLPERADVVVVGGGIIGCSIAYHLTKRGVSNVVVLEQGTLTSGTTWHAAGLVSQLKATHSLTKLATYSTRLFEELEAETGQATGYRAPGSISVASNAERWEELLRGATMARNVGVEISQIDLGEVNERWPLLRTDDLVGALWLPKDGVTSPVDTTMALAKGARNGGARIIEGVAVTELDVIDERVVGVGTEQGYIAADTVVLAGGMWTRQLAASAGVHVPLQACEHFYLVTEPLAGITLGMPTVRDPDNYTYFKEETGKIMAGFFEPRGKIWNLDDIPRDFTFGTLPEDWDHVGPIFERACHRVPALADCGLQLFFNGPEAFTPDGVYHLGETPEVDGCFVAAGFNSVGIQSAGGVGWALADWIVDGHPPFDLSSVDIRRTFAFQSDRSYLANRIPESLGLLYAMHWPFRQYESGREQRKSPLHDRVAAAGAVFGETAGWERPNWFAPPGVERRYRYSYGKQNWVEHASAECRAVRDAVALFDQSSFAKFRVSGPDSVALLNEVSANNVDVPIGRAVYTQWCNSRGGIEADLTVTRLGPSEYLVVTGAASETRDWTWLRRAARGHDVMLDVVTEDYAVLGLMGPKSRAVLSAVTDAELGPESFPFGGAHHITVAGADVLAIRISYVGELGWELYIKSGDAGSVFDALVAAGHQHGLRHAGYHAMNMLRTEAGYRHWGHDITDEDTPVDAGLGFAVAWDKPSFTGKEALQASRQTPRTKRLVQFRVTDPDVLLYHDEPIYRDGELVGRTSSAMWSQLANGSLAMGYLEHASGVTSAWLESGAFEIEVALERHGATASLRPFYSPRTRD